jgi:hypothetical protein
MALEQAAGGLDVEGFKLSREANLAFSSMSIVKVSTLLYPRSTKSP